MTDPTFTYVVKCRDCDTELNRAIGVPEHAKGQVTISAPLVAGKCPEGCRSTWSDCNLNWKGEWFPDGDAPENTP